jgi:predicted ATPase
VFEDAHWMDPASLDLLTQLGLALAESASHPPVPVLLVVNYRQNDLDERTTRAVNRLQREEIAIELALEGLDEENNGAADRAGYHVRRSSSRVR